MYFTISAPRPGSERELGAEQILTSHKHVQITDKGNALGDN
jgi:hypothetical protein